MTDTANQKHQPGFSRWIVPIVVLPGTVIVLIPTVIGWLSRNTRFAMSVATPDQVTFWIGIGFLAIGCVLSIWSMSMFFRFGDGTAAPWDPPKRFVVRGPYRFVRNPMLTGVIATLIAMSLLTHSWPLAGWAGVFFIANDVYFRRHEEPALHVRFGKEYRTYCENVRRWIPRVSPWTEVDSESSRSADQPRA